MGGHQLTLPVWMPPTYGRATKRQGDLAIAQQDTDEVNVVSSLALGLHMQWLGLSSQAEVPRFTLVAKQLWCADVQAAGALSILAERKASLENITFGSKLAHLHKRYWHSYGQLLQI